MYAHANPARPSRPTNNNTRSDKPRPANRPNNGAPPKKDNVPSDQAILHVDLFEDTLIYGDDNNFAFICPEHGVTVLFWCGQRYELGNWPLAALDLGRNIEMRDTRRRRSFDYDDRLNFTYPDPTTGHVIYYVDGQRLVSLKRDLDTTPDFLLQGY